MSQQDHPQPTGTQSTSSQPADPQPDEQQRVAAWAAVHRPETTGDELLRIVAAHPEFAPAIAAHPNAPATAGPNAAQPQYVGQAPTGHPQYAALQYSAGYAVAGQPAAQPRSPINVPGIIAFALLVLVTVLGLFSMTVQRQAMVTFNYALMWGFPLIRLLLVLTAVGLGIAGARMRSKPRLRWMAVGSIVTGGFLVIPLLLTTLSYAMPRLFSYYIF